MLQIIQIRDWIYDIYTDGASPGRVDAHLGSTHARNYREICGQIETVNTTVLPRGTWKINRVQMKRNQTLGSDSMDQQHILPSGTRWRTAAGRSSISTAAVETRTVATQSSSNISSGSTLSVKTDSSIAQTTPQSTYFYIGNKTHGANNKKKVKMTHKESRHPRFEPLTLGSQRQIPTCWPTLYVFIRRPRSVCIYMYE